jgi:hypothetical protein
MQLFAPDADVVMVTSEESLLRGPARWRPFFTATRRDYQLLLDEGPP